MTLHLRTQVSPLQIICIACVALMLLSNAYTVHTADASVYKVASYVAGGVAVVAGGVALTGTAPAWVPFVAVGAGGLALIYNIMDDAEDDEDEEDEDYGDEIDDYYDHYYEYNYKW